ncbi:hypothetical protein DSCOOX_03210 [Desulfosarcina ovata subsp. ovata]|uniref:Uncharacterized protein n=1 Tax=Desulfosarcina ovata subsp. ovata TaxID=2752305 RepID=A0A5K8A3U7_9BACT|nr:hypothetical protein DSCOOX_03210 [Desulfosarcina ovata subsp. ovata]
MSEPEHPVIIEMHRRFSEGENSDEVLNDLVERNLITRNGNIIQIIGE